MQGRSLFLVRVAWVVVAGTALAIVVFSVPSSYEYYSSVCTAASRVCSERAVGQVTPEGVQALRDVGLSVRSYAISNIVFDKVFQLVWFAVGALIFWRRSDDGVALLTSLFLVTFGTVAVDPTAADSLVSSHAAWWLPVRVLEMLGTVFVALFFLLFPSGRFVPWWTRWLAIANFANLLPDILFPDLYSLSPFLEVGSQWVFMGFVVSLVWSQVYRYRMISTPEQRLQTRWVVFGTTLAIAGTFPFRVPVDFHLVDGDTPFVLLLLEAGFTLSFLLVPFSIGMAMVRSRLFDVDVLINRTLVYAILSATLAVVYFGGIILVGALLIPWSVPVSILIMSVAMLGLPIFTSIGILRYRLYDIDLLINRTLVYGSLTLLLALVYFGGVTATQALFQTLTDQRQLPQLAVVISTLVIAALFNPLRFRIQSFIDRRFYRRKYDAARTLEGFSAKLRDKTDLDGLNADLVTVVRETMQPEHVSLWLRPDTTSEGRRAN